MTKHRGDGLRLSIQILQLRPSTKDPSTNVIWWTSPRILAPSIRDLFSQTDLFLAGIPEAERFNLFYTVHESDDAFVAPRSFQKTNTLIFDIDNIIQGREADYIDVTHRVLRIPPGEQVAWVASGNGLHAIICLDDYVTDPQYFKQHREQYRKIIDDLTEALEEQRLSYVDDTTGITIGKPDPSVFDAARVLRMPGTINKKEGRPDTQCRLLTGAMSPIAWDWEKISGIPDCETSGADTRLDVSAEFEEVFGVPDTAAVQVGCEFLKHCHKDQETLPEPEWYMMLNLVGRLENGAALVHEYSKDYKGYSAVNTNKKLQQALTKSRAYKCSTVNSAWGKCHTCKYFNKIATPLLIVGPDHIKTAATGFHTVVPKTSGGVSRTPNYEDLRRYFQQKFRYITLHGAEQVNVWKGTHWEPTYKTYLHGFAEQYFETSKPKSNMCTEFEKLVKRTNLKDTDWLVKSSERKINFKNGTLDLATDQFTEHRPEYGMTSVLPYDYDSAAICPKFERFLLDVTGQNHEDCDLLLEYMGYCFSGDDYWRHNVLFLLGEGRNGKSLFVKVMQACVGDDYYSAVNLSDLQDEQQRALLVGKLFNISEETPEESMLGAGSILNALSSGAMMTTKVVFEKPLNVKNKAKMIIISNFMPKIRNIGRAALDRLLMVKFDQEFTEKNGKQDPFLFEKLLPELPGIMNLAIAGYKRLKARGQFIRSKKSEDQTHQLLEDNDTVLGFFNECLKVEEFEENDFSGEFQAVIYRAYKNWCLENGYKSNGANKFWSRIRERYIFDTKKRITQQKSDNQKRKIRGVYLLGEERPLVLDYSNNKRSYV